ncbi:phytanoyl-CoA dioxygenase family protein [Paenibacillus cymbidii]|uniref:phytanoyl-CoA dioxygenase family protein n=1 Tax=Paenibacillus cymbidii TaxID=1639034 RepID=UPI0010808E86|nr:phytanoyl-CoA dioxygenase family protein [Paenibacillus cymbidii]
MLTPEQHYNKNPLHAYESEEHYEQAKRLATSLYRYDQLPERRIATIDAVTDDDVKRFWSEGYVVIDRLIGLELIEAAKQALSDIIAGAVQGPRIQFVGKRRDDWTAEEKELSARVVTNYVAYEPRLQAISHHPDIERLVARLFGETGRMIADQALLKPPGGGAEKPWHQDMAYGNFAYDKSVFGIWIALDPAELDNGCMHIIPYSHRDGGVPHYAVRDWQICDTSVRVERDVAVPLPPGGALLFSSLLHHGTPPNFTPKRRRALQIHYAPESAVKLTPQEYKRIFTNEMTNAEC